MKIVSITKDGVLVDMSLNELAHILDKAERYDIREMLKQGYYGPENKIKEEFIGKTIHLADIWKKMHDHIRLQSGLDALKMDLSKMLSYCERAKPIADEVAEIIKPKKTT